MNQWQYRVRASGGDISEGQISAATVDDVMDELRRREVEVVSVELLGADGPQDRNDSGSYRSVVQDAPSDVGFTDGYPTGNRPMRLEPVHARPPAAPREVPKGTTGVAGGTPLLIIGGFFAAIASVFLLVGAGLLIAGNSDGLFFVLFPLIHFSIGVGMIVYALKGRAKRRNVIANGDIAMAQITETDINRSVRINGRSPYRIRYVFDVNGQRHEGKRSTMNRAITEHEVDDRIWVIYDPEDPSRSVEWPLH